MNSQQKSWHGYAVSANVSLLFTEVPYLERFGAAAAAGFTTVESWWPFATADPTPGQLGEVVDAIEAAGVGLTGMNVFAGDMAAGERGIACLPERAGEFEDALASLSWLAERTGCRAFNLLHGRVPDDGRRARRAAVHAYRRAADVLADLDGEPATILVEPLARGLNGSYPLETPEDAFSVIDEAAAPGLALLLDTFHLAMNDVDITGLIDSSLHRIGHVQLADAPGRGEPGSGTVDFTAIASSLRRRGYEGGVAAEYKPTAETVSTLGWLQPAGASTF